MATTRTTPTMADAPAADWLKVSARVLGLVLGVVAIGITALLSLRFGSLRISTEDAWNAVFHYDAAVYEQTVVRALRVPRTIIALGVGAGLAVAGTIMQGVTRSTRTCSVSSRIASHERPSSSSLSHSGHVS